MSIGRTIKNPLSKLLLIKSGPHLNSQYFYLFSQDNDDDFAYHYTEIYSLYFNVSTSHHFLCVGQEKEVLSLEEFYFQYITAYQEGNEERLEQLVQENNDHSRAVANELYNRGIETYQAAKYNESLSLFMISLGLDLQLGNRE